MQQQSPAIVACASSVLSLPYLASTGHAIPFLPFCLTSSDLISLPLLLLLLSSSSREQVLKTLVIIVALFALCWLPLQAYTLLQDFFPQINE